MACSRISFLFIFSVYDNGLTITTSNSLEGSVSKYIRRVKTIADHLAAIGDQVSNRNLMIFIIGDLGSNFNYTSFVTSVNMSKHKPFESALRDRLKIYDYAFQARSIIIRCSKLITRISQEPLNSYMLVWCQTLWHSMSSSKQLRK